MEITSPTSEATTSNPYAQVNAVLERGVEERAYPGAVMLIGRGIDVVMLRALGNKTDLGVGADRPGPLPMTAETVFDIGSLTSIVATTTLMMKLVEDNKIRLSDRITNYIQGFGVNNKNAITVEHVLGHCAGLPAHYPFFEDLIRENAGARMGILNSRSARDYVITAINRSALKYQVGSKQVISEVGFVILGALVEVLTGLTLERAFQRLVAQPLGLKSTSFVDLPMLRRKGIEPVREVIAPTEQCSWRNKLLWGEVQDDNAWAMGGISGFAGLFSTVQDLHRYAAEMMLAAHGQSSFLRAETFKTFWRSPYGVEGAAAFLGFDIPNRENLLLDCGLSAQAVGTNGMSGCSLWLDPERRTHIILLTNRVHPTRANRKLHNLRPEIFRAALAR